MQLNFIISKISRVLAVFLCFLFAGCIAKYYELEHEPTKIFLKGIEIADIESAEQFVSGGALFVPFFNKLTASYPVPESYLRVYCLETCNVKIKAAILSSGSENYTMDVNKDVEFSVAEKGYLSGGVKLFDSDKFDVNKLSVGDEVSLKVIVNVDGELDELVFKLALVEHRDIKWST